MLKIVNGSGYKQSTDYHAEVPFYKAPRIKSTKIIDGIKFYIGENGKQYFAELYDRYFKAAKGMVNPNRFAKGDLIGNGAIWQ